VSHRISIDSHGRSAYSRELQEEPSSKLEESMKFGAETIKTEVECLSVAQYKAYKQSVESETFEIEQKTVAWPSLQLQWYVLLDVVFDPELHCETAGICSYSRLLLLSE
jgi:hypothetical protein